MSKLEDLTNKRFGRLVVLHRDLESKYVKWVCKCDCGNVKSIRSSHLLSNSVKSCGCLLSETTTRRNIETKTIHGGRNTRLYNIWHGIKQRCYDKNFSDFTSYGARNITMCDEWKHSFIAFRDWSLSNGYSDNLTIDRIDNKGNYEPSNCRWVTVLVQNRNRTNTIKLQGDNDYVFLKDIADNLGVPYHKVFYAYSKGANTYIEIRALLEAENI